MTASTASTPTPPLRRPLPWVAAALLALSTLMAACGPGVGGTGTGVTPTLARFGATPEPLCLSDIAPLLECSGGDGSAPVALADGEPARRVAGRALDQRIELNFACEQWRFDGFWGRADPPLGARFYGMASHAAGPTLPAMLTAQPDGTLLVVQLFDELGAPLSDTLALRRVAAPATLEPACP